MKQLIQSMCIFVLFSGLVFSGPKKVHKSEIKIDRMKRVEPDYRRGTAARDACPFQYPTNENSVLTVIDSSANGYGMVSTVTRPFDVNSNGDMLVVYRQYAGENTTHGQLGAGYGVVGDGEIQWDVQYNVNQNGNPPWGGGGVGSGYDTQGQWIGAAQARYPSAIASEEYPYAIWNEYTGGPPTETPWGAECSSYGGRPYFSYDEFGWGGESWFAPSDLDPLYECDKDLWTGSVGYGYDADNDEHHVTVVYDDWTRTGSYQFTSEVVEDGYIVLGSELLAVNPQHLGTDGYSSAAILSMNDNGQGLLGVDGIFAGNDPENDVCGPPASNITCNKVPMFRMTDDYGATWYGDRDAFDFYYVPDEVFDDIFSTWPTEITDPCTGATEPIIGFWSWYEFDMRVDNDGNPHMVVSLIGETATDYPTIDGKSGFYHITIDRDNLEEPGEVNTATGWNWSYIPLPANDSFNWARPDGYSYLFGAMCQISLSRDNPDIVYMVANIAEQGQMSSEFDSNGDGVEDDPCGTQDFPWELYPNWSEDIWVAKSTDNGSTWTALENLTQTPLDPNYAIGDGFAANCSPEEQYVHTAHWSFDDRVYFQYNQPNWAFNEIGDPLGADHMNRVYLGYSYVDESGVGGCTDANNCSYDANAAFDNGSCAIGIYTCADGSSGCGCAGECADTLEPPTVEDCNGICNGGAVVVCNSVSSGGGSYCADAGTEICTETNFNDGLCGNNDQENINSWYDCNGDFCGETDPLFGCDNMVTWDGGRCYTCWNGDEYLDGVNSYADCAAAGSQWLVATENDCSQFDYGCNDLYDNSDPNSCPTYVAEGDLEDGWVPFVSDGDDNNGEETGGPSDECSCTAYGAEISAEFSCSALGDLNGDSLFNVLDIVTLANCVLAENCGSLDNGCAGDMNEDTNWNVLDIVTLANCVLAENCGGRVADASESKLIIDENIVSIEANGFIGGVQMTLSHGPNFRIDMTNNALYADYLTKDNQTTRLLVINPESSNLFSYTGDFEISEIIVANSQFEVSVDLPIASEISLSSAYPNPFNPTTTMTLNMPLSGEIKVEVYNLLGQVIATLANGNMDAGKYNLTWDASNASSGMYFVKAQADGFTTSQKLMLVK